MNRYKSPLVSVIIPVKNRHKLFLQALQSVVNQKGILKKHIIIIDDGSNPSISKFLEGKINKKKFTIIRNNKSLGPAQARNIGLKYVKGCLLAFLDGDDFWDEDYLNSAIKLINFNKSEIVVSKIRTRIISNFSFKTELIIRGINLLRNAGIFANNQFWGKLLPEYFYLTHLSSSVFTKQAFLNVKFDKTFKNVEDWKFVRDCIFQNKPLIKINNISRVTLNYDLTGNTFKRPHVWKDYYRLFSELPINTRNTLGIYIFKKYIDFSAGKLFK